MSLNCPKEESGIWMIGWRFVPSLPSFLLMPQSDQFKDQKTTMPKRNTIPVRKNNILSKTRCLYHPEQNGSLQYQIRLRAGVMTKSCLMMTPYQLFCRPVQLVWQTKVMRELAIRCCLWSFPIRSHQAES